MSSLLSVDGRKRVVLSKQTYDSPSPLYSLDIEPLFEQICIEPFVPLEPQHLVEPLRDRQELYESFRWAYDRSLSDQGKGDLFDQFGREEFEFTIASRTRLFMVWVRRWERRRERDGRREKGGGTEWGGTRSSRLSRERERGETLGQWKRRRSQWWWFPHTAQG